MCKVNGEPRSLRPGVGDQLMLATAAPDRFGQIQNS